MSRPVAPGGEYVVFFTDFDPGLEGTLGFRTENVDGSTEIARSVVGVEEVESSFGIYSVTATAPTVRGDYLLVVDDGTGGASSEPIQVTYDLEAAGPTLGVAYATIADVQQQNQGRTAFGASSSPRIDQVVDWLGQTAGELDGILRSIGADLPLPASATSALKFLEHANALGAAWMVEKSAKTSDRRKDAWDAWMEAKRMLRDGELDLEIPGDPDREMRYSEADPIFSMTDIRGGGVDRAPVDGDLGPLGGNPSRDF